VPVPRGSTSKKRRVSDEDSTTTNKRMRHESSYDDEYTNSDMHARHSLPNHFSVGSSILQDIAFSAQQALDRGQDDDLVPVDPALQAYASGAFSAMEMAPTYQTNGDSIMSSIEQQAEGDLQMDGLEFASQNGDTHGRSVEPLTPGPPPHNDTIHARTNGYAVADALHVHTNGFATKAPREHNAVRHPSSPVSPRHMSAVSPTTNTYNNYATSPFTQNHDNYNNFAANANFPPPPFTPPAHYNGAKQRYTSSRSRPSKTPKPVSASRRRDSKDSIKLEAGFGMSAGLDMSLLDMDAIDPNLDQASIELIKQLQAEEHGLRRRSR
jgi:F-box/leucine-rich repeat protein 10/11